MGGGASACRDITISAVSYCIPDLALPTLPTALPLATLSSPDDASPIQLKNGSRANLDKLKAALKSEAAVAAWLEQQGPEWVDGALNMLPALAEVLSVVVNVVVPPPGGQVLQIVLQNLAALASLGRDLSSLMALVLNPDTVRALEVKKSTNIALEALQDVAKRIYDYIEETKERKPWPIRLFLFALTRVEILELEQQLEKAKALLQLTSNLEVAAIVLNSEAQAEAAGAQVKQIMARRGLTEQQLAADPTALGEAAAALAGSGSMKLAVDGLMLGALKEVMQMNCYGPHRLVKNKVLSRLWQQYLVTELENLKKSLSDDRQKQAFRLGVDKCDKEVLSIDELNKAIPDVDESDLPHVVSRTLESPAAGAVYICVPEQRPDPQRNKRQLHLACHRCTHHTVCLPPAPTLCHTCQEQQWPQQWHPALHCPIAL
ncbi:uncharacterized protein HaLaN_02218, partial [Haematococcus lacustris]